MSNPDFRHGLVQRIKWGIWPTMRPNTVQAHCLRSLTRFPLPRSHVSEHRSQTADSLSPSRQPPSRRRTLPAGQFKFLRNGNNAACPSPFPNPSPNPSQIAKAKSGTKNLAILSNHARIGGGMAQTPNPSRRPWVGPAPVPFLTPRPERKRLEMRWDDGAPQSAARRSGLGAAAGNGGGERDREVNVQVVLRCR